MTPPILLAQARELEIENLSIAARVRLPPDKLELAIVLCGFLLVIGLAFLIALLVHRRRKRHSDSELARRFIYSTPERRGRRRRRRHASGRNRSTAAG